MMLEVAYEIVALLLHMRLSPFTGGGGGGMITNRSVGLDPSAVVLMQSSI